MGANIRIFCRAAERLETPIVPSLSNEPKPWLVYIPGGPGFGASAPQDMGLTGIIVDRGYRFLCFDHRGMGLSTPVTAESVLAQGDLAAQVDYLRHFRADNAVRDLEAIRKALTSGLPAEKKKWSLWGQSYGGFVTLTYLSYYPQGLREVFSTGGLAPITQKQPDEVYRRLWAKVLERNRKYYAKYPEDQQSMRIIMTYLHRIKGEEGNDNAIRMPSGGVLTPHRFRSIGISFGALGGLDDVHNVVLRSANDLEMFGYLSRPTLAKIEAWSAYDSQPLYAVLHEPAYNQGAASKWSAAKVCDELNLFEGETGIYFFGEMVFPGDLQLYPGLKSLAPAAQELAKCTDWPNLYDLDQLKQNEVPLYAAVFVDDMYVDFGFAQETASLVRKCKTYVTNAMYHDAVRSQTEGVGRALFALRDDTID
jgi:pimeloyl-ACP methyl ester carboxylesterase